jgi:hypothetical protein
MEDVDECRSGDSDANVIAVVVGKDINRGTWGILKHSKPVPLSDEEQVSERPERLLVAIAEEAHSIELNSNQCINKLGHHDVHCVPRDRGRAWVWRHQRAHRGESLDELVLVGMRDEDDKGSSSQSQETERIILLTYATPGSQSPTLSPKRELGDIDDDIEEVYVHLVDNAGAGFLIIAVMQQSERCCSK